MRKDFLKKLRFLSRMKLLSLLIILVIILLGGAFQVYAFSDKSKLVFGAIRSAMIYDDEFEVHYNVLNYGNEKSKAGTFQLYIPDLDYYYRDTGEDLNEQESFGRLTYHKYKNLKPGTFLARVVYQDDDSKTVKWIYLDII